MNDVHDLERIYSVACPGCGEASTPRKTKTLRVNIRFFGLHVTSVLLANRVALSTNYSIAVKILKWGYIDKLLTWPRTRSIRDG